MDQPPIKKGYLYRPQKGIKKYWVKRWALLYPATETHPPRLETFDSKEAATKDGAKPTVLSLCNPFQAIPTTQHRSREFVLEIIMEDKPIAYAVDSREDLESWLQVFAEVAGGRPGKRTSCVPDLPSFSGEVGEGLQENTLYDSYETKTFSIVIKPTAFSDSLNLHGNFSLQIDSVKLSLLNENTGNLLYAWPYRYLRRYGRDKTSFSMEAGRKCDSGPGLIVFETKEGNDIFHNIQNFVNNISGRQFTPPTQPQQTHAAKDGHQPPHEPGWKPAAQGKGAVKPPPVAPRSHTKDPIGAITESSIFKQKLAERKGAVEHMEAVEPHVAEPTPRRPKPHQPKAYKERQPRPPVAESEPDPVYSEVQENTSDQSGEPLPPMPEGEYFLPEGSEVYSAPSIAVDLPESSVYDLPEMPNPTEYLYDRTVEEQKGEGWKVFGRTEDNIHTENYLRGLRILEDEGASSDPEPIKPVVKPTPVRSKPPAKPLPKARPTIRSKPTKTPDTKKDPVPEDPSDQAYDTVGLAPVPGASAASPAANGQDMYDHFVRPTVTHPVPAPRKGNLSQTSQVDDESELYDHLQREVNTGGPRMPPKPYTPKQRSFDPEDAYDVLVHNDDPAAAGGGGLITPGVGSLPEESQYSEAILPLQPEQSTADANLNSNDENPYDLVSYE